jgi:hypothetical protein
MIFNVAPNHITRHFISYRSHKVAIAPKPPTPQLPPEPGKLTKELSGRYALDNTNDFTN